MIIFRKRTVGEKCAKPTAVFADYIYNAGNCLAKYRAPEVE